jgi:ABC-type sugar transport systems, permease components
MAFRRARARQALSGYLFITPTMAGYLIFCLFPAVAAIVLSLFEWNLLTEPLFVGLKNYLTLLASSSFWNTAGVTIKYVLLNVPAQIVLSFILASILNQRIRGYRFLRGIYLLPWALMPIAISMVWKFMLDPNLGYVTYLAEFLGIWSIEWFSPSTALITVVALNIWQHTGFTTTFLLIGLESIDATYVEAASIDGASGWSIFWKIRLPLMLPVLIFVTITSFIGSFQVFDAVFALTQGGPGTATNVYYLELYRQAFSFLKMGYASAMAVLLFLVLLAITLAQLQLFRKLDAWR